MIEGHGRNINVPTLNLDACLHPNASASYVDFLETSFFQSQATDSEPAHLPDPSAVLAKAAHPIHGVVTFEDIGLVVKFGPPDEVILDEAQTLRTIRNTFTSDQVPVPELFGWRKQNGLNFIYMSLIAGTRLKESWQDITRDEKWTISLQLGQIIAALRTLPYTERNCIGSINGGPIRDLYFRDNEASGPFQTVKDFNDQAQFLSLAWLPPDKRPVDPFRPLLPDEANVFFSHADLHSGNVLIGGPPGARKIVSIIDWGQAGWYPEYWEYCKLRLFLTDSHEWWNEAWLEDIMDCYEDEFFAFAEYWSRRSP